MKDKTSIYWRDSVYDVNHAAVKSNILMTNNIRSLKNKFQYIEDLHEKWSFTWKIL